MSKHQQASRGPDYGIAKVLRGYPNFEDVYQGLPRGIPIALSTFGSKTMGREPNAASNYASLSSQLSAQTVGGAPVDSPNVDGVHSPNLVDAVPTVLGSNCIFLLPRPLSIRVAAQPMYKLIWRIRGIDTFAKTQLPYHANLRGFRYQDKMISTQDGFHGDPILSGLAAQRGVMATVAETIRITPPRSAETPLSRLGYQAALDLGVQPDYEYGAEGVFEGEPGELARFVQGPVLPYVGANGQLNSTTNQRYVYGDLGQNPLAKAGGNNNDQGDEIALYARTQVSHVSYSTVAKGDEVIILVYNVPAGGAVEDVGLYNFDGGTDFTFSCLFGRGGYRAPLGSEENSNSVLFPNGSPFGVYLIQGHS